MDTLKNRAMVLASGNYLTAHFPDDFDSLEPDLLDLFMEENAWEPFEDFDTSWVYEQIEICAESMVQLVKENQI